MSQLIAIDWTDTRPTECTDATPVKPERCDTNRCLSTAVTVMALSFALFVVSACNTLGGAGKDLESAGDAIADTNDSTAD